MSVDFDLDLDPGPEPRPLPAELEPDFATNAAGRLTLIERLPQQETPHRNGTHAGSRAVDGATFINSVGDTVPAVWGDDNTILWAEGEPLMIVGPDGVGKTSIGQQLALARIGIRDGLFGYTVKPAERVLYVAADRPRQAASSLRRMVTEADLEILRERLIVWRGPLPFDVATNDFDRCALAEFAESFRATDVVIDSLKDIAVDLVKDDVGARISQAVQETIARGIEVVINHHQRKAQQGTSQPRSLAEVYGSRWLTAGMGSVILVWGEPGDLVVDVRHLKQPVEEVGPLKVIHDHTRGRSTVHESADLEQSLANASDGIIVAEAARLMFEKADPSRNEIEKARRRLETLVTRKRAERRDDPDGLARYFTPKRRRDHRDLGVTPS